MTTLTKNEWEQVVQLMGSAPLRNMVHAGEVDQLIAKVMVHGGLVQKDTPATPAKKRAPRKRPAKK